MAADPTPRARHNFTPDKFPITFRVFSGKTNELLWERTVTLEEARDTAQLKIPGYAETEHYPVRCEITYADGTTYREEKPTTTTRGLA